MVAADEERYLKHLVSTEGVSPVDAADFLEMLARAEEDDPAFHEGFVKALEERILVGRLNVERTQANLASKALERIAGARETRVGPGDVRSIVESARRAATELVAFRDES